MTKRKNKRKQRKTVQLVREGERREQIFYEFLYEIYDPYKNEVHINTDKEHGGSSNSILEKAFKFCHSRDKVYAWFDEDVKIDDRLKEQLAREWGVQGNFDQSVPDRDLQFRYNPNMKNPILIVSSPRSCDGFLVTLFSQAEITSKHSTTQCKNAFDQMVGGKSTEREREYYKRISKQKLEDLRKKNRLFDLLVTMFEK